MNSRFAAPDTDAVDAVLDPLNAEQRQAVTHINGPALVLAGPGSGKTRVITHKVAYLLAQGIPARQVLGVTFTNKAANEMQTRVEELLGGQHPTPWISTFHSAGARILREHLHRLDSSYSRHFSIMDESDQRDVIRRAIKELDLSSEEIKPAMVSGVIGRAKDELIGPDAFKAQYAGYFDGYMLEVLDRIYRRYQAILQTSNAVDFADLIRLTVRLFQSHLDLLQSYRERFRYLLVDEYQDINHAQYVLVQLLAEHATSLTVVGDEDQAIFGWRGSNPDYILCFERDFPNAKIVELRQHYRWPQGDRIFRAARNVIAHNASRAKKGDAHFQGEGDPICYLLARDEREEALAVTDEIIRLWTDGVGLDRIAILYRVNSLSRVLEEALLHRRLPYQVVRGVRFYDRREVKDVLAYLKVLVNPDDEINLLRALERPKRGIGATTIGKLQQVAAQEGQTLWAAMKDVAGHGSDHLGGRPTRAVTEFVKLMEQLRKEAASEPPADVAQTVLERSGYWADLLNDPDAEERTNNVRELLGQISEYQANHEAPTLASFLEEVALLTDADRFEDDGQRVALMTLHTAKGLEFDYVFMIGVEENLVPHNRAVSEGNLEEERRLFYVGMTRARRRLYLSLAHQRTLYGSLTLNGPSRFFQELPQEDVESIAA